MGYVKNGRSGYGYCDTLYSQMLHKRGFLHIFAGHGLFTGADQFIGVCKKDSF